MKRDLEGVKGGPSLEDTAQAFNTLGRLGRISRSYGAHVRGLPQPIPPGRKGSTYRRANESYELYDIILEYLIQEGYADTLGSAEIILENMSEEWIEEILSEESAEYRRKNWQPITQKRKERIKRQMTGAYNADRAAVEQRNQPEANKQWRRQLSMTFQTKMPRT